MAKNDTLLVTPEVLDSRASDLRAYMSEHEGNMKKLATLVNSIDSVWRGDSQLAYSDEYKALNKNAEKVSKLLENYAKTISEVSNRMRTVNEQTATTARKYTES